MRVTLVTETYFPQVNGVSRTLGQLARVLGDAGDAVQLIHPDYGEAPTHEPSCLVRSTRLPFYPEVRLPLPPFGGVHRALREFAPDIVHVATEATLGLAALRFAERLGIPVVSSFHTRFDQYTAHYGLGWAQGLVWRYLRWFHNRTRETYVPSRATLSALAARGFERLVLWPRGVDSRLFRPDRPGRRAVRASLGFGPDDQVIASIGRLAAEKNVAYLAEALARVAGARAGVKLLIVGDGPARADLERRLGAWARFAGYRTGDDLADHYAAADLFAFASRTETFGNVVLEAMAAGLPVVALRAGGPADIVQEGVTGLLVDPDDPPERFAEALARLVDDAALRRGMAASARAYAEAQSWEAIMSALRARYRAIAGAAAPDVGLSVPAPGRR